MINYTLLAERQIATKDANLFQPVAIAEAPRMGYREDFSASHW